MTMTHKDLMRHIVAKLNSLRKMLKDSSKSFNTHVNLQIGFYSGYCEAKYWQFNGAFFHWLLKQHARE